MFTPTYVMSRIMFAEHSINKFNVNNLIQDVYIFIYIN